MWRILGSPVTRLPLRGCQNAVTLNDWHDFFVMLGGATAALTGLLFVAMSLHVRAIGRNPPERRRARGTLTGLIAVLLISAVALRPGMDLRTFGLFLLVGAFGLFVQALFVIREFISLAGERRAGMIAGWRLRSAAYVVFELAVATVESCWSSSEAGRSTRSRRCSAQRSSS